MNSEAILKNQVDGFKFAWKSSDCADKSIIAYGWANYGGKTISMHKRFKINWERNRYIQLIKVGRKFLEIGISPSLEHAKIDLQNHWKQIMN